MVRTRNVDYVITAAIFAGKYIKPKCAIIGMPREFRELRRRNIMNKYGECIVVDWTKENIADKFGIVNHKTFKQTEIQSARQKITGKKPA